MDKEGRRSEETRKTGTDWRPAVVPALGLVGIGVLPGLLKGLYEPYTANLVTAYVSFGMLFMVTVIGGLSVMVFRDLASRRMKIFRFAPEERLVSHAGDAVPIESSEDRIEKRQR
jgi:hypothetical protein